MEVAGLDVWLVNAKQAKNVPDRPKTDPLTELMAGGTARRLTGDQGRHFAGSCPMTVVTDRLE